MSLKKGGKTKKHLLLAKLVTGSENSVPCAFCNRVVDDEIIYGKLYAIGDIQCHYFCVLLSCCLIQKGKDEEGLFGFLYPDIIAELERSKKHKCSYCGRDGATLGCTVSQCRKQFHLPCGRERNAVSLFYGNFKSFCERHAPRQRVNDEIMAKARPRKAASRKLKMLKGSKARNKTFLNVSDSGIENSSCNENISCHETTLSIENILCNQEEQKQETEAVCVICYENVDGFPTLNTFWPPCCARDAWFHRSCLQRMALSAGMHYLKCPLCNQKEAFYEAVMSQGYYVPDRDASWELEQNAFAEIYERPVTCSAPECSCPMGRDYDADAGAWDIRLCVLCGSSGVHSHCSLAGCEGEDGSGNGDGSGSGNGGSRGGLRHVCPTCAPAAPEDLDKLVVTDTVGVAVSGSQGQVRGRPMPSRMSLRRTKQRALRHSSASASDSRQGLAPVRVERENQALDNSKEIETSRLESNPKAPERPLDRLIEPTLLRNVENKLLSPLKLLEQGLRERLPHAEAIKFGIDPVGLIAQMRERFSKPKPLVEKKKIVNDILENVLESLHKDKMKTKEPLREWNSPKKCAQVPTEAPEENQTENRPPADEDNHQEDFEPPTEKVAKELLKESKICNDGPPNILEAIHTEDREGKSQEWDCNSSCHLPAESVADDSNSCHLPEKSVADDGNSCHLPEKSVADDTNSCHLPEESVADDSNSCHLPEESVADDGNSCHLPEESVADDTNSCHLPEKSVADDGNGLPLFESPKKKPVLVQNSSMEISHEHSVSIDLVKNPDLCTPKKSLGEGPRAMFKLRRPEAIDRLAIDVESFKCRYLNEVDRGLSKRKSEGGANHAPEGKAKRRRGNVLPKKDIRVKLRWRTPTNKYTLKYTERRLVQTSLHSFFGAKPS